MKHFITTLGFMLAALAVFAQIQLAKDLVTVPYSQDHKASYVKDFVELNGVLYFSANTSETGRELWRSDGTEAGTWMVKDIFPGWRDGDVKEITVFNNRLYFRANSPGYGYELWVSDGTAAGTHLFEDLFRGNDSGNPTLFTLSGGLLFFSANSGVVLNKELWRSDGSPSGTYRVRDIFVGDEGSYPSSLIDLNGTLYFAAETAAHGRELWKSDGTHAGTQLVKDIYPGISSGMEYIFEPGKKEIVAFQNNIWFAANSASNGTELWVSDGTTAGTQLMKNLNLFALDSDPENFTLAGNKLYFTAETVLNGRELWGTDGTVAGTVMIEDIEPGAGSSNPRHMISSAGILYFSASTTTHGSELWRSLGTSFTTYQVADIRPGADGSIPRPLAYMGGKTYFSANNGIQGHELYSTTGAAHTTSLVRDMYLGSSNGISVYTDAIVFQNKLFYSGGTVTTGLELASSDGTILSTQVVKDIRPQHNGDMERENFYLVPNGNSVYCVSSIPGVGKELCKSDGTGAGTGVVKDISQGGHLPPRHLFSHQNTLFFSANNGNDGLELWKTTGSEISTVQVADINPGQAGSSPNLYYSYKGDLYFIGNSGCCGYALMKYDGLSVSIIKGNIGFYVSYLGARPTRILEHQNIMYFASGIPNGVIDELWRSDGTTMGTYLVKDINPGNPRASVRSLTSLGNDIYFTADDGVHGTELWKSDGTALGTVLVRDIQTGPDGSFPEDLIVMNGNLYFRASTGTNGEELFRYNPAINSLTLVKEIGFSHNSSYPDNMVVYNNALYFTASDGIHGREIWKTQGTSSSTQMLKDIYPGKEGSGIEKLVSAGGYLFFTASDSIHGHELWSSDGTLAGTTLYEDLYPGPKSSSPRALTLAGSKLFMFAFDSLAGTEIHSLNIRGISLPVEDLEVFGQYEGSAVKLDWNTVHEHNTQYFEVQRSQDRVLFNTVGRVGASGTYEGKLAYAFTDVDPLPGTSFYRLKLVDVDGTFIHSSVIEVFENKEVTLDWKIAGNPVQNKLLRVKGSAFTGLLQLSVYDLNGKMLWKQDVQSGARSAEFQLPAQMASGMYILQIENQFKKIQQRFICE